MPHQALLHRKSALDCSQWARELDEEAVAGSLHNPATMLGHSGFDYVGPKAPDPRHRSSLVLAHKPREADHIGSQNRRKPSSSVGEVARDHTAHGATKATVSSIVHSRTA